MNLAALISPLTRFFTSTTFPNPPTYYVKVTLANSAGNLVFDIEWLALLELDIVFGVDSEGFNKLKLFFVSERWMLLV